MEIGLLAQVYDEFVYLAQDIAWRFSNKPPQLDQLADNLRRLGLSPAYINRYLGKRGVDETFQRAVETDDSLTRMIMSDALTMSNYPHNRVFSRDEKREYIAERIADRLR